MGFFGFMKNRYKSKVFGINAQIAPANTAGFFVDNKFLKIAVCGSATGALPKGIFNKAREIGKFLAKNNIVVFTGATTGYSYEAAKGAFSSGGLTVGISPAESLEEHINYYKLPTDAYRLIIYTGHGYKARDIVLIRSIDAVIFIGGGVGTLCELSAAIDCDKVIGILKNSGGVTDISKNIAKISHRIKPKFIYDSDPESLVNKLIKFVRVKNYGR